MNTEPDADTPPFGTETTSTTGRLHHHHGDHCDDHRPVQLLEG